MAQWQDDLETARDNIASRLATLTASMGPDYSLDGKSVQWSSLHDAVKFVEDIGIVLQKTQPFSKRARARSA